MRLLATTDLHAHLRGFDYDSDEDGRPYGLTRVATLIRAARAEVANALLFDVGDLLQGTAVGDLAAHPSAAEAAVHPMVGALNRLRTDAACPGNHDFNYGLDVACTAYAGARFPVVCANLVRARGATPAKDTPLFPPWTILERRLRDADGRRRRVRVGLIGALPPQVLAWDEQHLRGRVEVRGIVEAVRGHIPEMRAAGADLIEMLCHAGMGAAGDDPEQEQAATAIAGLPEVDAVLAGHAHRRFPGNDYAPGPLHDTATGMVQDTPLVMAGAWGSHLGVIDLTLTKGPASRWQVVNATSRLRAVATREGPVPEDPALRKWSAPHHRTTRAFANKPVARVAERLHTYFAFAGPCPALATIAAAKAAAVRAALRGTAWEATPLVVSASPFKSGGRGGGGAYTDVPAGPVSMRHLADLYTYPNSLRALRLDGAGLRAWAERMASVYDRLTPGTPRQRLLSPLLPGYEFDVLYGVTYRIDLSAPPRYDPDTGVLLGGPGRVRSLSRPVTDEDVFVVGTSSYRASGGGGYPGLHGAPTVWESTDPVRSVIAAHLSACDGRVEAAAPWRFAPLPGTSAVFETSTKARTAPDDIARLGLTDLGDSDAGLALFEVDLNDP